MIDFLLKFDFTGDIHSTEVFLQRPSFNVCIKNERFDFFAWGDPIVCHDFEFQISSFPSAETILKSISGHYYYYLHNKISNSFFVGNSFFGILPVYFQVINNQVLVADTPFRISNHTQCKKYNKRFLLENILFNYPLFNESCTEGISLLPCNHLIEIVDKRTRIIAHTHIESYFSENPTPWKRSVDKLSDLFIEVCQKYLPDEPYFSSLTGGLDGRTLTACGLYYKKPISTYSFGSETCNDVVIASRLSDKAGIKYYNVRLDENYVKNDCLQSGIDFINASSGTASFSRAHYLYATKDLSTRTNFLLTGNFGSEIFRAAHIAGVVISPNLYTVFFANDYDEAIQKIENSEEWNFINRNEFKTEWESLKEDLRSFPCFSAEHKLLTKNQQFYKIVFEEIFRKYFGAEMVNQFRYLSNRTPFLDFDFVKAILSTSIAGVHSDFFTHNPLKRFKGQALYAHIINKTYPQFGREITDKGYSPNDLMSINGKIKITKSFFKKRLIKKPPSEKDANQVYSALSFNSDYFKKIANNTPFFNNLYINQSVIDLLRKDSLIIAFSQAYFYNEHFK